MSDEIPYPPKSPKRPKPQAPAGASGKPPGASQLGSIDWEAVRARVGPTAAELVDGLRRDLQDSGEAASEPVSALRAVLARRLAELEDEFERVRNSDRGSA